MPGCMLTTSFHSSNTQCQQTHPQGRSRSTRHGTLAKWGLQHRFGLASPGAGHLCGKQLPGAKQPCKAPLDAIGRHVAWCAGRAREIRYNRLRDFLVECVKTTGAIATSEQAMPLPRHSQPAAREPELYTRPHPHPGTQWHGHLG